VIILWDLFYALGLTAALLWWGRKTVRQRLTN